MGVLITATLGGGILVLKNREIEHLEVNHRLGEPHRCVVRFDLDTSNPLNLQDFHGPMSVEIADEDFFGGAKAVLFEGVMTGGTQDHQLRGGSRFELKGATPLLLGMELRESQTRWSTSWEDAVKALDLQVIGAPRYPVPRGGYGMFGESRLEFVRRMADDAGFFVIERDGQVQLRSEFDDSDRRDLTWGSELLRLRAASRLVNHRFRGAVYEQSTKSAYRFRDQRKDPVMTGALKLTDAVRAAAPGFANERDPDLVVSHSRAPYRDVFRGALQRESERTLGGAVVVQGNSRDFFLRAGGTIQINDAPGFPLTGSTGVFGLIDVDHRWDSAEYTNEFRGTPWKNFSNLTRPPLRTAGGPHLAEALQTPPELLARGFLFVRMAHNEGTDQDRLYARLTSPFAGNQRGVVFVPEPGDEVLIGFAEGDPEHAYVLGSLWNGVDQCPGQEPKQIVTRRGIVLAFRDGDDKDPDSVEVYTPKGKCMLQFSAGGKDPPRVTLHSEGDLILEAPKGQVQINAKSLVTQVDGGAVTTIGGDAKVAIKGKYLQQGPQIHLKADQQALVEGGGAKASLSPGGATVQGAMAVLQAQAMAVVTGAVVQLNPPAPPPPPPPMIDPLDPTLPGGLKTSWSERAVPAATNPVQSDGDPEPPK